MPVLREVVTRFRLETNEGDYRQFNAKLSVMKGSLRQLASIFGVTLGVAGALAIGKMGLTAERARFQLERMAGGDYSKIQAMFRGMQMELEKVRKGASAILRPRQFDEAAASFFRVFGTGQEQIQAFGKIFEFASKQAALTGKDVVEIAKALEEAIATGGFEALMDIPGFTQFKKQFLEFQQEAIDPNDPGRGIGMKNRMRALLQVISSASAEQDRALKKVPAELLNADAAGNKMQQTLEKLGQIVDKTLVPALERMVKVLDYIIDKFVDVDKAAAKAGQSPGAYMLSQAATGAEKFVSGEPFRDPKVLDAVNKQKRKVAEEVATRKPFSEMTWKEIARALFVEVAPLQRGEGKDAKAGAPAVVNYNTFQINSTDPMGAAREVEQRMDNVIRDARSSSIPTEAR